MRRGAILTLVAIGLAAAAVTILIALYVPWLPESASEEREGIDFVFWFTTAICIGIFSIVAAVTVYAGLKFRVQPDDDSDGPPIHGHTGLEIAWTAVPAVLVTAIAIVSAVVLARNDRPGPNPLRVEVTAQQFAWSFKYPDANGLTSANLRLPVGRSVKLYLQARDVIHSFWVPEFGQKQDVVPGDVTTLIITPTRTGDFRVICTELCGLGHSLMRTRAIVMDAAEFDAWLAKSRQARDEGGEDAGKSVFADNGCGGCHTLSDAGTQGATGPSLDDVDTFARPGGQSLEAYIRSSILEPDAYVHPGFAKGVMPKTFGEIPKDQLDALVQYLVKASKKAGT